MKQAFFVKSAAGIDSWPNVFEEFLEFSKSLIVKSEFSEKREEPRICRGERVILGCGARKSGGQ